MSSESLTVTLPAHLAAAVRDAVASAEYESIDAAVEDALTMWARREEEREEGLAEIRAMVGASMNDPRPTLSLAEVDAHLDAFFRNVEQSRNDEAA